MEIFFERPQTFSYKNNMSFKTNMTTKQFRKQYALFIINVGFVSSSICTPQTFQDKTFRERQQPSAAPN